MSSADDINDIFRQESSRGRNWLSSKAEVKAHRQWLRDCKNILSAMSWEEVVSALGLRLGSAEYGELRKTWIAYHGDSGRAVPKPRKPKL